MRMEEGAEWLAAHMLAPWLLLLLLPWRNCGLTMLPKEIVQENHAIASNRSTAVTSDSSKG